MFFCIWGLKIHSKTSLEKVTFSTVSSYLLKIASGFWMWLVSTSAFSSRIPLVPDLFRFCTRCHTMCKFICASLQFCLKAFVSLVSSIPLTLTILFPLPPGFLRTKGEGFGGDIPFRIKSFKVYHTLHIILLGVSLFLAID